MIKLSSILLLLYYLKNNNTYCVLIKDTLPLKTLLYLHYTFTIIIIVTIMILIFSLIKKQKYLNIIAYIICTIIYEISIQLTINELLFIEYTTIGLFEIYHPINLIDKQTYMNMMLQQCYENCATLQSCTQDKLNTIKEVIENNIDLTYLRNLDGIGMKIYAQELFSKAYNEYDSYIRYTLANKIIKIESVIIVYQIIKGILKIYGIQF